MTVARFWRKIPQRYNLIGTKCETCGRHFFPPRTFCPDCRREGKIVDHKFAGKGTVVTYHDHPDRTRPVRLPRAVCACHHQAR